MKVKLKDFECKYNNIELIVEKGNRMIIHSKIYKLKDLKKKYGDYYVSSYKYYEDTKTTSIIIGETDKWDCEEDITPHCVSKDLIETLTKELK